MNNAPVQAHPKQQADLAEIRRCSNCWRSPAAWWRLRVEDSGAWKTAQCGRLLHRPGRGGAGSSGT